MSTTSPNSDSSKSPQSNSLEESSREDSDATICFLSGKKCRGSLTIVDKLNCMYEDRMSQIEKRGSGKDCVKAKISVQRSWIGDLKEQNAALREVLEELEREALKRVEMLERKLRTSEQELAERTARAQGTEDQLKKATEKVESLTGDVTNLVRLVKRAREEGVWSTDGLDFRTMSPEALLGNTTANGFVNYALSNDAPIRTRSADEVCDEFLTAPEINRDLLDNKDSTIRTLRLQLNGGISELVDKSKKYEALKKSMSEMREALTAEVAEKHDTILGLRRDLRRMEERCLQADESSFKLRKEIKRPKQCSVPKKSYFLVDDPELIPVISVTKTDVVKRSNSRIIYLRQNDEESVRSIEKGHLSEANAAKRLTPEKLVEKVRSENLHLCNCKYSAKYQKSD